MDKRFRIFTLSLNTSLDRTFCLDRIVFGDINRIKSSRLDAGGKGLNVARMLHRLGQPVCSVVCLGGDNGKKVKQLIQKEGLSYLVVETSGETRNIFNLIETRTGRILRVNEPGPEFSREEKLSLFRYLTTLPLSHNTIVVLSGSFPPGLPVSTYRTIINLLKKYTPWITLDADGAALQEGVRARPWLIKPNLWELQRLCSQKIRSFAKLKTVCRLLLHRKRTKLILLTLGSQGALAVSEEEIYWAKPPALCPVSEVGCGDAFLAGFLYGWVSGWSVQESLIMAVGCGSAKVTCPGTSMPSKQEVFQMRKKVKLLPPEKLSFSQKAAG